MVRRQGPSGGLMALRAALGAVAGGLEGYSKSQELERRRKVEEQAAQLAQFNALRAAEFRMAPVRTQADPAAAGATALDTPKPAPSFDTTQQSALGKALSAGMGVGTTPTSPLTSPVALALDTSKMRQFERGAKMQAANPVDRITVGGMELGVRAPETPEEKAANELRVYEQKGKIDTDTALSRARAERGLKLEDFNLKVQQLTEAGIPRQQAIAATAANADFADLFLTPKNKLDAELSNRRLANEDRDYLFRVSASNRDFELRQKEYDRRLADSEARRERMPEGARKRLEGLDAGAVMVRDVTNMLTATPDAIGPVKGRLFRSVVDALDKDGVGVRAYMEALTGELRNQRFGGALTATEAKMAEGWLPNEKDNYESGLVKLQRLEQFVETKRKALFTVHKQEYTPIFPPADEKSPAQNPYR